MAAVGQALVEHLHDLLAAETAGRAEGIEGQQQGGEQGGDRVADQVHPLAHDVLGRQHHVGEGLEQHQHHRQQHGDQGDAEAGQVLLVGFTGDLVHQLLGRVAGDVARDEVTEQRAGDDGGGQGDSRP
jgi:hypothetical protein